MLAGLAIQGRDSKADQWARGAAFGVMLVAAREAWGEGAYQRCSPTGESDGGQEQGQEAAGVQPAPGAS
jgi:hypothetical protein